MTKLRFVTRSREVMGENIALHSLLPRNQLPHKLRNKIPANTVYVREDRFNTPKKQKRIRTHEGTEVTLMRKGVPYKQAHRAANKFEKQMY